LLGYRHRALCAAAQRCERVEKLDVGALGGDYSGMLPVATSRPTDACWGLIGRNVVSVVAARLWQFCYRMGHLAAYLYHYYARNARTFTRRADG